MKINSKNKSRHFGHAYDTFLRWCGKEVVGPSRDWSCEPLNLLQYLLPLSYTSKEGCHDHSRNVWFCSYYEFVKFLYIVCLDSVVIINQFLDNFNNVGPQPNSPAFVFQITVERYPRILISTGWLDLRSEKHTCVLILSRESNPGHHDMQLVP